MGTTAEDSLDQAVRLVQALLPADRQATSEEIGDVVNSILGMLLARGDVIDRGALTKRIQALVSVFQEDSAGLVDGANHEPWLHAVKSERTWDFWERYRRYLEDVRMLPSRVVRQLDRSTEEVLEQLEDPLRTGSWRRTGLTLGQVQSGKTGHYIGLCCKAVDAGYRLVVVLAGIHNDLRSQTQLRVDEGLLGFDSQYQLRTDQEGAQYRIGAGAMPLTKRLDIASLTNSTEKGDFGRQIAAKTNIPVGNFPVVLVIKKHARIIEYLRTWITEVHGVVGAESGLKTVHDVPLLIIDDEADNASINVSKDPDTDPSKINAAIRRLLNSFGKSAYVGYTATPFANIYIDPKADHDEVGADLFPESFIRSLRAPSNYLSPERVFGLQASDDEEEDVEALPLVRYAEDYTDWLPSKHGSGYAPSDDLPDSLREAVDSFILACAARRARGQGAEHNSMLVHVTRFTAVQGQVRDQVDEHLRFIADTLRDQYSATSRQRFAELSQLWENDFLRTSAQFDAERTEQLTWSEVQEHVLPALLKIQVKAINGTAKDALDYYENRDKGISVIAIGGEKLSRGLTLEGLTVSYYLRHSKTYDALLQMGRWFGYRPGYEDLCRLYTTPLLERAYVEITAATDELRREIEEMAALGLTPRDFGLKVRSSSMNLSITAPNKMRQGTKVLLSYSGEISETVIFNLDKGVVEGNLEVLEGFVGRLDQLESGSLDDPGPSVVWKDVPPELVVSAFFDRYVTDRGAQRVRPAFIAQYIRKCMEVGELSRWTVRLVSKNGAVNQFNIAGHQVGLVERRSKNDPAQEGRLAIQRLVSPSDEGRDVPREQVRAALAAASSQDGGAGEALNARVLSGPRLRLLRSPDQAHLLIYPLENPLGKDLPPIIAFAVSFPHSPDSAKTEYVVNAIWRREDIELFDEAAL